MLRDLATRLRASFSERDSERMRAATSSARVSVRVGVGGAGGELGVPSRRRTISPRMEGRAREGGEDFGCGAAEELFVELGEFAGEGDALVGPKTATMSASASRMRCGVS